MVDGVPLATRNVATTGVANFIGIDATAHVVKGHPYFENVDDYNPDPTDATAAFQAAFTAAVTTGKWGVIASGIYVFDADNATSISVSTYGYGDASLKACIVKPYGVRLVTAGYRTEFRITNVDATTCGIAITEDVYSSPTTHSQTSDTMEPFVIRPMDGNGRYGVVTPKNASIFANKRPIYNMAVHFCGPNTSQTVTSYGWDYGLKIGDNRGGNIHFQGFGTYNAAAVDAGQHNMTGMHVDTNVGSYGLNIHFNAANMRQFFVGGDGLEGFSLRDFEGQGCWEGVILEPTGGEPGGFVDAGHINANRAGYRIENRPYLHIGRLEAYRSDDYYDHGSDWDGLISTDCDGVGLSELYVVHGGLLNRTNSRAATITTSTAQMDRWVAHGVDKGIVVDNSPRCQFGAARVNTVDIVYYVTGASSSNFEAGSVVNSGGTTSYYVVFAGGAPRGQSILPQKSGLQSAMTETITISAAATKTVKKRLTPSDITITMSAGAGAFTYDVLLDHDTAVPGDIINIKINGSSSANPTLRICDHTTGTILSTFNTIGGTKRLLCTYVLTESNTWAERSIIDSVELSY